MIKFNPSTKVTSRHMDALREYTPVYEDIARKSYWVGGVEYKSRRSACGAMLQTTINLVESGIYPHEIIDDLLTTMSSQYQIPLFIRK